MSALHCFFISISLMTFFDVCLQDTANKTEFDYVNFVPRVVNGRPAQLGDVPYQIAMKALIKRSRIYVTFCGGVIVAPTKLLSAAHCFVNKPNFCQRLCGGSISKKSMSQIYAVAGNLQNRGYFNQFDSSENGQWRKIKKIVYPRTYRFPKDDIAIVFTFKPFVFNNYVNSIPYASRHINYHGSCLASGFGRISKQSTSDKLLLADLTIIPTKRCSRIHRRNMRKFVCTSDQVTDVGKGDSGGPLVCMNTGDPNERPGKGVLVGIVSGNRRRASSFFTRVSYFYKYIERNTSSRLYNFSLVILIVIYYLYKSVPILIWFYLLKNVLSLI